jgi:hypothetical protein
MKLLTGLFRVARKRLQTKDGGENFKESLMALVENADNLSEDDINAKIDELKVSIDDLPDDTEKEELSRYLEDFRTLKEQEPETAKEAAEMVIGLYDKLDASASADAPATAEIVEEKKPATDGGEAVETIAEEKTEETKDGCVKDSGVRVAVTLGGSSNASVDNLFNMLKNRRR